MLIDNLEFPDDCPDDCIFIDDFGLYGQNSICLRCPVLNCGGSEPLFPPEDYREDWVKEWKNFFDGLVKEPDLRF